MSVRVKCDIKGEIIVNDGLCITCNKILIGFDSEYLCNQCWDEGLDVKEEIQRILKEEC